MSLPAALEALDLSRRYGRRWALVRLGFAVPRGRCVMLAGRNGSGKSTLIRVLAGAIRADGGTARVEGHDVAAERTAVRESTSLLSHASYHYDAFTARENLALFARLLGRSTSSGELAGLLQQVGLFERAEHTVATFSAGMRKRLALARVLLKDAPVVLLDEPYGELDPPGFRLVDELLARWRQAGRTVLMATHLIERGSELCDEGLVLEEGRLRWSGRAALLPAEGGLQPALRGHAEA